MRENWSKIIEVAGPALLTGREGVHLVEAGDDLGPNHGGSDRELCGCTCVRVYVGGRVGGCFGSGEISGLDSIQYCPDMLGTRSTGIHRDYNWDRDTAVRIRLPPRESSSLQRHIGHGLVGSVPQPSVVMAPWPSLGSIISVSEFFTLHRYAPLGSCSPGSCAAVSQTSAAVVSVSSVAAASRVSQCIFFWPN